MTALKTSIKKAVEGGFAKFMEKGGEGRESFDFKNIAALLTCVLSSFAGTVGGNSPFCYALTAYIILSGKYGLLACLGCTAGVWYVGGAMQLIKLSLFSVLVFISGLVFKNRTAVSSEGLITSACLLLAGSIYGLVVRADTVGYVYFFCESVVSFGFYYIYLNTDDIITNRKTKNVFTLSDTISLCVSLSVVACGLSSLEIQGISAATVATVVLLMYIAAYASAEATLTFSVIGSIGLCICLNMPYPVIATFALCALFGALTKPLGKILQSLSIASLGVFGFILTQNISGAKTAVMTYTASFFLFLISDRLLKQKINAEIYSKNLQPVVMNDALSAVIGEEIDIQKRMLEVVSRNIGKTDNEKPELPIKEMCRTIAQDVCYTCNMCSRCWGNEAEDTYKCFSDVMRAYEAEPSISYERLPNRFLGKCTKSYFMFKIISCLCDAENLKKSCSDKLDKFKALTVRQFEHIGKVLNRLSATFTKGLYINNEESKKALAAMQTAGIEADKLIILENFDRKKKFFLSSSGPLDEEQLHKDIPLILSELCDTNVIYEYSSIKKRGETDFNYAFCEQPPHALSVGVKRCSREEYAISGDSVSNTAISGGIHIVALSDGMGSGKAAGEQSARVLNMFEELLNSGCDETDALDIINSILVLEQSNEIFSTLDVFIYNLNSSEGEFVKAGASPTYIRYNGKITKVDFESLPVGVLETMQVKKGTKKFEPNEFIYMMSDGFYECIDNNEDFLMKRILTHNYRNPQKIADSLFKDALEYSEGKAPDDVTVMVVKVR